MAGTHFWPSIRDRYTDGGPQSLQMSIVVVHFLQLLFVWYRKFAHANKIGDAREYTSHSLLQQTFSKHAAPLVNDSIRVKEASVLTRVGLTAAASSLFCSRRTCIFINVCVGCGYGKWRELFSKVLPKKKARKVDTKSHKSTHAPPPCPLQFEASHVINIYTQE